MLPKAQPADHHHSRPLGRRGAPRGLDPHHQLDVDPPTGHRRNPPAAGPAHPAGTTKAPWPPPPRVRHCHLVASHSVIVRPGPASRHPGRARTRTERPEVLVRLAVAGSLSLPKRGRRSVAAETPLARRGRKPDPAVPVTSSAVRRCDCGASPSAPAPRTPCAASASRRSPSRCRRAAPRWEPAYGRRRRRATHG